MIALAMTLQSRDSVDPAHAPPESLPRTTIELFLRASNYHVHIDSYPFRTTVEGEAGRTVQPNEHKHRRPIRPLQGRSIREARRHEYQLKAATPTSP